MAASENTKYMTLSNTTTLEFVQTGGESAPKAILDITNSQVDSNIAYKIKTTAPKLFVVKPI